MKKDYSVLLIQLDENLSYMTIIIANILMIDISRLFELPFTVKWTAK